MNRLLRPLALLLALLLTLGLAGCNMSDTTWVYQYEGERLPAGIYINYLINAYSEAYNELYEQRTEEYMASGDPTALQEIYEMSPSDLFKQELDGVTVADRMVTQAQAYALRYFAAQAMFEEAGLALDDDNRAAARGNTTTFMAEYEEMYEKNGIAESSILKTFENEEMKEVLFAHIYGAGGEREVAESELRALYAEEYGKAQVMTFNKVTEAEAEESGSTLDELNAEVYAMAQEYQQRLAGGEETYEALVFERELSVALANGLTEDVTQAAPGEADLVVMNNSEYAMYYGQELIDALFAAPVGEVIIHEGDSSYILIHRLDVNDDAVLFESLRNTLSHNLVREDFNDLLDERAATLNITVNQKAVDRYKPSWLTLS